MNHIKTITVLLASEEWKDISGFTGYSISNQGRVRSNTRAVLFSDGRKRVWPERILVPSFDIDGYPFITMSLNNKRKTVKTHILVGAHFIPFVNGKHELNHINGSKYNSSWLNIERSTRKENIRHAYDTGLASQLGERNNRSILNNIKVRKIKKMLSRNIMASEIAKIYGVHRTTINDIKKGRKWKHIN
jgi:DNA-binding XRE family transcriptional regulator